MALLIELNAKRVELGSMHIYYLLITLQLTSVLSYHNRLFTLTSYENISDSQCGFYKMEESGDLKRAKTKGPTTARPGPDLPTFTYVTISGTTLPPVDPLLQFEDSIYRALYGRDPVVCDFDENTIIWYCRADLMMEPEDMNWNFMKDDRIIAVFGLPDPRVSKKTDKPVNTSGEPDKLAHYPTGQGFRAEMFQNKSAVHLPFLEFVHRGHCHLRVTRDYMQTAVNAFAIFIAGNLDDILRLPSQYVLHSARTIAMMKIAREKLAATWTVVKGSTPTDEITYETLERYRPLFKYLNGKEMAKLNLSNERILSFIGTHPDLSRHQVGVVASRYIQLNPDWTEPKYLNMMNNLLCGVPMIFMRRIPENTYLQLTHQIFYHIRACDPLQRRFYLAMMMRTQALGKSYSWSAREVSRLGLLLAEVSGSDLSAINPEAMSGITAQVMLEMPIHNLKSITEMQLRYLEPKPLNILARKLIAYQNLQLLATGVHIAPSYLLISVTYVSFNLFL